MRNCWPLPPRIILVLLLALPASADPTRLLEFQRLAGRTLELDGTPALQFEGTELSFILADRLQQRWMLLQISRGAGETPLQLRLQRDGFDAGRVYLDRSERLLVVHSGAAWQVIDSSSGSVRVTLADDEVVAVGDTLALPEPLPAVLADLDGAPRMDWRSLVWPSERPQRHGWRTALAQAVGATRFAPAQQALRDELQGWLAAPVLPVVYPASLVGLNGQWQVRSIRRDARGVRERPDARVRIEGVHGLMLFCEFGHLRHRSGVLLPDPRRADRLVFVGTTVHAAALDDDYGRCSGELPQRAEALDSVGDFVLLAPDHALVLFDSASIDEWELYELRR